MKGNWHIALLRAMLAYPVSEPIGKVALALGAPAHRQAAAPGKKPG
jgi:hypothetical protein